MVRNMKTTMPSKVRNKLKVREHFQGSDMQLREYKSRMGTCYMKGDLYPNYLYNNMIFFADQPKIPTTSCASLKFEAQK